MKRRGVEYTCVLESLARGLLCCAMYYYSYYYGSGFLGRWSRTVAVAKRKKEKAARESSTVVVKLLGSMFAR